MNLEKSVTYRQTGIMVSILQIINLQKKYRSLFESILSLGFLQMANMILPLITLPYLVHVLGAVNYGIYVFSYSVTNYFSTIIDYGFKLTATRDIAINRDNKDELSAILSRTVYSKLLLSALSLLSLIPLIPLFKEYNSSYLIFYYSFFVVITTSFFPDWFFQGIEKMRFITIINLVARIVFTIAIFVFIRKPDDYVLVPLIGTLGGLVALAAAWYVIYYQMGIRLMKQNISSIFQTIKESTPVFLNSLFPTLYNNTSAFLLGLVGTPTQLAYYGAAQRIVEAVGVSAVRILSQAFFPFLNTKKDKTAVVGKIFFYSGLCISLFFVMAAPLIVKILFTPDFQPAVWLIRILGLSVFFFAINDNYGLNYLLIKRKDKLLMHISMFVSLIGLAIAFPLIYQFKHWGAALTILLSRMLFAGVVYYYAQKIEKSERNQQVTPPIESKEVDSPVEIQI